MRKGSTARAATLLAALTLALVATPQASVQSERLQVYARMDEISNVVTTLKRGDAVVIEMSVLGKGNTEWCSIRDLTAKTTLGYVRCEFLSRPPAAVAAPAPVQAAPPSPPQPPLPQPAPPQPATLSAGRQAASGDFWDLVRRDSRFGDPGHQVTLGEMRYLSEAAVFDAMFGFSLEQKYRALQIAGETGIPACIEDTNKYVRKGQMPPDIYSNSSAPLTGCDWIFQAFYERTFALVTPEQQAAHRASYAEFSRQVTGRRHGLSQRLREAR